MTDARVRRATGRRLNVLVWHVHGSWTASFVQGGHRYLIPFDARLGAWARGRCGRPWPDRAVEVAPEALAGEPIDVVVAQRPRELDLIGEWSRRRPGVDVPVLYVEHNTPDQHAALTRHPLADRPDLTLVHVTHFNRLMWDSGRTPVTVIPCGVPDPGYSYTGELPRAATVVDEPVLRWRVNGTDLLVPLSRAAPIDVYGIGTENVHEALRCSPRRVHGAGEHPQDRLHRQLARRRVFVHTPRWTSLGLSVLEAMHLGMPVVAVAATEAHASIPPEAGVVSADPDVLTQTVRHFLGDRMAAEVAGKAARQWALTHFGLHDFVRRWDDLLVDAVATGPGGPG
ncbi:glycosyltransferase [Nocardia gipuzkoensis]